MLNLGDLKDFKDLGELRDKWIKFRIEIDNSNKTIRFLINGIIAGEVKDVVFNFRDWHDGLLVMTPSVGDFNKFYKTGECIYQRNSGMEINK